MGPAGKDGKNGLDGKPGLNGKDGKNGLDGKPGVTGPAGKNGLDGKAGPAGPMGPAGKPGPVGPMGPPGPAGSAAIVQRTGGREISTLLRLPDAAKLDSAILRRVGDTVELTLNNLRSKTAINQIVGRIPDGFRPIHAQSPVTSDADFRLVRVDVEPRKSADLSLRQAKASDGLSSTSTSLVWLTNDDWPSRLPGKEYDR
ncbi:MAG: hypothetical protein ACKOFW_19075, partial [Planctomycetaceae bacterium]